MIKESPFVGCKFGLMARPSSGGGHHRRDSEFREMGKLPWPTFFLLCCWDVLDARSLSLTGLLYAVMDLINIRLAPTSRSYRSQCGVMFIWLEATFQNEHKCFCLWPKFHRERIGASSGQPTLFSGFNSRTLWVVVDSVCSAVRRQTLSGMM